MIGYGAYSVVWEGLHIPTKTPVAIKREKDIYQNLTNCKRILREVKLLRQFNHPSIVKLYDVFPSPNKSSIYLILELTDADLRSVINSSIYFTEGQVRRVFYNIITGLKYLQSAGVLHRDIKPENILLNENCDVRICDFGLSRIVTELFCPMSFHRLKRKKVMIESREILEIAKETERSIEVPPLKNLKKMAAKKTMKRKLSGHVVTRWYRAPEIVLMQKNYDHEIDIWSIGCVFAELQGMRKENISNYTARHPLFPGVSCYPLSPANNTYEDSDDQMNMIFKILGSPPSESDMSFIEEEELIKSLLSMEKRPKTNFSTLYPAANEDELDLLQKMLTFSPYNRMNINECLCHNYFKDIRKIERETIAPRPAVLEFDNEENLDEKRLRELFVEEFTYFENQREKGMIFPK